MHAQTIVIDLAKEVFEIGFFNQAGTSIGRKRLRRNEFERFLAKAEPAHVVMEACGSAHFWGREFSKRQHHVALLSPRHVRPFRRGNKTDRADVSAIYNASRSHDIKPVAIKSVDQQNLQLAHRAREQWKVLRLQRINGVRAVFREHGVAFAPGVHDFVATARRAIDDTPAVRFLVPILNAMLDDIVRSEAAMATVEQLLNSAGRENDDIKRLQTIPGIGLITSTAMVAAVDCPTHFRSGRQFSNWLGVVPKEHSSGDRRVLGKITRRGDVYLRSLLIHGARAVLAAALRTRVAAPDKLTPLQAWAVELRDRMHFNKAAVALANKLARIAWSVWTRQKPYDARHLVQEATAA